MLVFTVYEQKEFEKKAGTFTQKLVQDEDFSLLFFKVLANYVDKTNANNLQYSQLNESNLKDKKQLVSYVEEVLKFMSTVAVEESVFSPTFTTGQLAQYFGVSITTINNWIKEGRFVGVERPETNKQVRISANTMWKSRTGKHFSVAQIIEDYEKENADLPEEQDEKVFLINQLAGYEQKYGGSIQEFLGSRNVETLTAEEESDLEAWKYFTKRFDSLSVDRNSKD